MTQWIGAGRATRGDPGGSLSWNAPTMFGSLLLGSIAKPSVRVSDSARCSTTKNVELPVHLGTGRVA